MAEIPAPVPEDEGGDPSLAEGDDLLAKLGEAPEDAKAQEARQGVASAAVAKAEEGMIELGTPVIGNQSEEAAAANKGMIELGTPVVGGKGEEALPDAQTKELEAIAADAASSLENINQENVREMESHYGPGQQRIAARLEDERLAAKGTVVAPEEAVASAEEAKKEELRADVDTDEFEQANQ